MTAATASDRLPTAQRSSLAIAVAAALSLSVAMGVGRFVFTPLLPLMLHDGLVTLDGGSNLATLNYVGYFVGAMLCMGLPRRWHSAGTIRAGLVATVVLTLAMAVPLPADWAMPVWLALRLLSGIASAFAFVFTTSWCVAELSHRGLPVLGSASMMGPGIGIAVTGIAVAALSQLDGSSRQGWLLSAVLGAAVSAAIWRIFDERAAPAPQPPAAAPGTKLRMSPEIALLALAYGLEGIGYIITGTFLPVIAKQAMPDSPWLTWFWPFFGLAGATGAFLATRQRRLRDPRRLLLASYLCQAVGVVLPLFLPTALGFALSAIMVGMPFNAVTFFAMQEVRRLRPHHAARYLGLVTATYGIGQIVGPPLARAIRAHSPDDATGFAISLGVAASTLLVGAAIYTGMLLRWRQR